MKHLSCKIRLLLINSPLQGFSLEKFFKSKITFEVKDVIANRVVWANTLFLHELKFNQESVYNIQELSVQAKLYEEEFDVCKEAQIYYNVPLINLYHDKHHDLFNVKEVLQMEKGEVVGGTFYGIMNYLLTDANQKFMQTFLLTHQSFATGRQILSLFKYVWNFPPPKDLTALDRLDTWIEKTLFGYRSRICQIMRLWVGDYFVCDFLNEHSIRKCEKFIDMLVNTQSNAKIFIDIKEIVTNFERNHIKMRNLNNVSFVVPKKGMLKGSKHITMSEFSAKEIAQELTLIDALMFSKITTEECVQRKWDKESRIKHSPHIDAIIERSNQASQWFAYEILKEIDIKNRIKMMEFIIKIAKECVDIGNFGAVFYLIGSLNLKSIYRLKHTNEELPTKSKELFNELKDLMDSRGNFRNLRSMIKQRPTTCVPHIGLYMSDFLYIQDSNQDYLQNGFINFQKNRLLANILIEIFKWQKHKYTFDSNPFLNDLLRNIGGRKEEELTEMSLKCEGKPRSGSGTSILHKLFSRSESAKGPETKQPISPSSGSNFFKALSPRGTSISETKTGSWLNFDRNSILRKSSPSPKMTEIGKKDVQSLVNFSKDTKL